MSTAACDYDPLYLQGVAYFNACEFFEAHEVWEDLWKNYSGDLRLFYKGLIQAAVALHHFGNGNIRGARKVYRSSRGYLDGLPAGVHGARSRRVPAEVRRLLRRGGCQPGRVPEDRRRSGVDSGDPLDPPVELPPVVIED